MEESFYWASLDEILREQMLDVTRTLWRGAIFQLNWTFAATEAADIKTTCSFRRRSTQPDASVAADSYA